MNVCKKIISRFTFVIVLLIPFVIRAAADGPYDPNANANTDIQAALGQSANDGKFVLLIFGANWCTDCRVLAEQFDQDPLKSLIDVNFNIAKIDIGDEYEKNRDLQVYYNNATERGIPTIVVLDQDNNILFGTLTGELASARSMGSQELYNFFEKVVRDANRINKQ